MTAGRGALLLGALGLALVAARAGGQEDPPEAPTEPGKTFEVHYDVRLQPSQKAAAVTIVVSQPEPLVSALLFAIDPERHVGFEGDGALTQENGSLVWELPAKGGRLAYTAQIDHLREPAEYDARCTRSWALFRGTDIVPPVRARYQAGADARATLRVRVPPDWAVVVPFEPSGDYTWRIDEAHRVFDAPRGWMIMGELKVVRASVDGSELIFAVPEEHRVRARDTVAFLRWTLPEMKRVLGGLPPRIVIVGADDPMWRGGLSGPSSLYLHADRPLIDADGSSPILHELVHVVMRAIGGDRGDWIVEGLAEYYSLQILLRSGAMTEEEYQGVIDTVRRRGRKARSLFVEEASGDVTRRAVALMAALDAEIRERSEGKASLDDVTRRLVNQGEPVSYEAFRAVVENVVGDPLDRFFDRVS